MTALMWIGLVLVAIAAAFVFGLLVYVLFGIKITNLAVGLRRRLIWQRFQRGGFEPVYMEQVTNELFWQVLDPPPALIETLAMVPITNGGVVFYRVEADGRARVATSPRVLGPIVGQPVDPQSTDTSAARDECCRPGRSR